MGQVLGLVLLLLFVAFLLQLDLIFYVAYVLAGVYAWTRWYTPRAFRNLQAERLYQSHAFWGETVDITVRVTNKNRLAVPWLHLTESVAPDLRTGQGVSQVVSLARRSSTDFHYQVRATRRGYYLLGPLRFVTSDLFGLNRELVGYVPPNYLTVYPRITPLVQLGLPSHLPFGVIASKQRLFADPSRPMGVRDFRSGDSLRQINWKVSAHTQSLMVKTLEPAISLETAVFLNFHLPDYDRQDWLYYTEWAVEVAASLATHLIDQRQAVGLGTNGHDPLAMQDESTLTFDATSGRLQEAGGDDTSLLPTIPPRNGRSHLMKILERLARLEATNSLSLPQWLPKASLNLSWGVTLLVITPQGSEDVCQGLHRLVRAGLNPVLIAVEPDGQFGQVRERARQLGFTAFNVTRREHLDRWKRPLRSL